MPPPAPAAMRATMLTSRLQQPLLSCASPLSPEWRQLLQRLSYSSSSTSTSTSTSTSVSTLSSHRPLPSSFTSLHNLRSVSTSTPSTTNTTPTPPIPNSKAPNPASRPLPKIASPTTNANPSSQTLTWNNFLQLRSKRRRFNLLASSSAGLATAGTGLVYLSQQDLEKIASYLFGLDPMITLGMCTLGCGTVGWLLGPFAGNAVFGLWYRRLGPEMAIKEKEFYQRIKRHRVDPSSQSVSNPLPDFYGEKISSVAGYRQWLKDQRAFTKKRQIY